MLCDSLQPPCEADTAVFSFCKRRDQVCRSSVACPRPPRWSGMGLGQGDLQRAWDIALVPFFWERVGGGRLPAPLGWGVHTSSLLWVSGLPHQWRWSVRAGRADKEVWLASLDVSCYCGHAVPKGHLNLVSLLPVLWDSRSKFFPER